MFKLQNCNFNSGWIHFVKKKNDWLIVGLKPFSELLAILWSSDFIGGGSKSYQKDPPNLGRRTSQLKLESNTPSLLLG